PGDLPRSVALTLKLRNEVRLVGCQHTICTTVVLVVGAAIKRQVSAARNIYSLRDQTHSPARVVSKACLEALFVGVDSNGRRTATFHRDHIRSIIGGRFGGIVGIEASDDLRDVHPYRFGGRFFIDRLCCCPCPTPSE